MLAVLVLLALSLLVVVPVLCLVYVLMLPWLRRRTPRDERLRRRGGVDRAQLVRVGRRRHPQQLRTLRGRLDQDVEMREGDALATGPVAQPDGELLERHAKVGVGAGERVGAADAHRRGRVR
jgi:hypothetical protein